MPTNDAQRIFKLEQALRMMQQQIQAIQTTLGQLAQNQFGITNFGSGGGGNEFPLFCTPTGGIAGATGPPASGAPGGPLTGQTVYSINAGAFVSVSTNVDVYNGMESAVVVTNTLLVLQNADGTYTAVGQSCI